ncbi:hypothetical protein BKA80DRAFT_277413 [Phyllosticta citrichinensis]
MAHPHAKVLSLATLERHSKSLALLEQTGLEDGRAHVVFLLQKSSYSFHPQDVSFFTSTWFGSNDKSTNARLPGYPFVLYRSLKTFRLTMNAQPFHTVLYNHLHIISTSLQQASHHQSSKIRQRNASSHLGSSTSASGRRGASMRRGTRVRRGARSFGSGILGDVGRRGRGRNDRSASCQRLAAIGDGNGHGAHVLEIKSRGRDGDGAAVGRQAAGKGDASYTRHVGAVAHICPRTRASLANGANQGAAPRATNTDSQIDSAAIARQLSRVRKSAGANRHGHGVGEVAYVGRVNVGPRLGARRDGVLALDLEGRQGLLDPDDGAQVVGHVVALHGREGERDLLVVLGEDDGRHGGGCKEERTHHLERAWWWYVPRELTRERVHDNYSSEGKQHPL